MYHVATADETLLHCDAVDRRPSTLPAAARESVAEDNVQIDYFRRASFPTDG